MTETYNCRQCFAKIVKDIVARVFAKWQCKQFYRTLHCMVNEYNPISFLGTKLYMFKHIYRIPCYWKVPICPHSFFNMYMFLASALLCLWIILWMNDFCVQMLLAWFAAFTKIFWILVLFKVIIFVIAFGHMCIVGQMRIWDICVHQIHTQTNRYKDSGHLYKYSASG